MNPKVRKATRDVERAERKLAELTAELKQLRSEKAKLEDQEIVRRVRAASAKSGGGIDEVLVRLESATETESPIQGAEEHESEVE